MKRQTIIAIFSVLLLALVGCERKTTTSTVSVGPFNVNSDSGMATGLAFGIDFILAGASGAEVTSTLAGSPKLSSRAEITLADDLKIELETMDEGNSVTFQLNGKNFGNLERGDKVAIEEDRNVMVSGEERTAVESPPK